MNLYIYIIKASFFNFLSHVQIHTYRHIFYIFIFILFVIPDSLLEVLVPVLLGNMSNILIFLDFHRSMLFVFKHTIWCENKHIYEFLQ